MDSSLTTPASKGTSHKTLWFLLFLMALVVAAVVTGARFVLHSEQASLTAGMQQTMGTQAQNQAAMLTVWHGALNDQATQLAEMDPVRLFASEMEATHGDPAAMLRKAADEAAAEALLFGAGETDVADASGAGDLAAQAPLMRRQFKDFILKHNLLSATLYTPRLEPYISTMAADGIPPSPGHAELMAGVVERKKASVTPTRLVAGGMLTMEMILPVFAPLYVDSSGQKCVALLVLAVDVTGKVGEATAVSAVPGESIRVLQNNVGVMQEIPADGAPPRDLPGWTANAKGNIPLDVRTLPAGNNQPEQNVYSLAVKVANLPWLVEHDLPVSVAEARYESFRQSVMVSAVLVSALAALILLMLWWALLRRGERATALELRNLYERVNQQKQIIDGVNASLADGIVLSNLDGSIPYANQAFAEMTGETAETLAGTACRNLGSPDVARDILEHTEAVRRANALLTFTKVLTIKGQPRHYQIVCSPFRDQAGAMTGVVSVYRDISRLVAAQERAQHMVKQTINVFVRAIEAVDPYLRGQSSKTGTLAAALAGSLELGSHTETLVTAANLSQIGMIQLPHQLLTKTDKLTPEERAEMQKHMVYAKAVLEGIDFGMPVLDAITQMHERLDGSGYPERLSGEAISMDARILAVASTFCAMLRPRSYRQARALEDAMAVLSIEPYQYDPDVVQALANFLQSPEGKIFYQELLQTS